MTTDRRHLTNEAVMKYTKIVNRSNAAVFQKHDFSPSVPTNWSLPIEAWHPSPARWLVVLQKTWQEDIEIFMEVEEDQCSG